MTKKGAPDLQDVVIEAGSKQRNGTPFWVSKHSGLFPRIHVDTSPVAAVGQAGGVLLAKTADVSGLTTALSRTLTSWRKDGARHDPGKNLTDLAIMLALGGDACSDASLLRAEPGVYGPVASDATISRTIGALAADADRVLTPIDAARRGSCYTDMPRRPRTTGNDAEKPSARTLCKIRASRAAPDIGSVSNQSKCDGPTRPSSTRSPKKEQ